MKAIAYRSFLLIGTVLWSLVLFAVPLLANPRPPVPPLPEGQLAAWRFNGISDSEPPPLLALGVETVESWSGYALRMAGTERRWLVFPETTASGKKTLNRSAATLRFWFSPGWSSGEAGGAERTLLEFGDWTLADAQPKWSLRINAQGTAIRLLALSGPQSVELLVAPITWRAGEWHQVALSWWGDRTLLHLDGKSQAEGLPFPALPLTQLGSASGLCIGSDVNGERLAQGQFEEFSSFARICADHELAADYHRTAGLAATGPITEEEQKALLAALAEAASNPPMAPLSSLSTDDGCSLLLRIVTQPNDTVKLTIHNTVPGKLYDVLSSVSLAPLVWSLETTVVGAAGQNYTETTIPKNGPILFFVAKERGPYETVLRFEGMEYFDSQLYPPDTMGAVGPNHFIELLNDSGQPVAFGAALYSRSGSLIQKVRLKEFFSVPGLDISMFDPRIIFDNDPNNPRWIACAADRNSRNVILAVSTGPNPTSLLTGWNKYVVPTAPPELDVFSDYPTLGVDQNGIYLSVAYAGNGCAHGPCGNDCIGHALVAVKKSVLYAGTWDPKILFVCESDFPARAIQPCVNFDSNPLGGQAWFIAKKAPDRPANIAGKIAYRRLVWNGNQPQWVDSQWTEVAATSYLNYYDLQGALVGAPNLGGPDIRLWVSASDVLTALIRDGILWTCQNVGLDGTDGDYDGEQAPPNVTVDRTGVQWLKLQLNTSGDPLSYVAHGRIFDDCPANPYYYYFPSMMVNAIGDMVVGFSASKATTYIGAFYSWRLANGTTGNRPAVIRSGLDVMATSAGAITPIPA